MEDKKVLTEEMRRDVDDFLEKQKAVREAKNLEGRKLVIHGRRTGEGKYVRVDGRDDAVMGLEGNTVIRYSLAKKEVLFVVAKGTRAEKEASLQKIDGILESYDLDEGAKSYYEKIKEALVKSLSRGKGENDKDKGGKEPPAEPAPETTGSEAPAPEEPNPEKPSSETKEPNIFARRSELEFQVRSLNRHIEECQNETNSILARASVHGLMPDDEQTIKDNNSQLKAMKEELKKVEEELAKIKEETDKKLDKYDANKKVIDNDDLSLAPEEMRKEAIMKALEANIANREAMLLGDRTFGADYIAELEAWKRKLEAYKHGDPDQVDTKSSDGKRDFMEFIEAEAKREVIKKLKEENSKIEEEIGESKIDIGFLLDRRKKEREEEAARRETKPEKPEKPEKAEKPEKPKSDRTTKNVERKAERLVSEINTIENNIKKLQKRVDELEGTPDAKNLEELKSKLTKWKTLLENKKQELAALGLSPEQIEKIEKKVKEEIKEGETPNQESEIKPKNGEGRNSNPEKPTKGPQGQKPERKEQEKKAPEKKEPRQSTTQLVQQQQYRAMTAADKLGYFSLGILDRFRAKKKAYEIENGHKPGFLRSASLFLPSMKYSRLADGLITDGKLSIDDVVYSKYRRQIQYFDEAYEAEERRLNELADEEPVAEATEDPKNKPAKPREPEKTSPEAEEPAPETSESVRPRRRRAMERASEAFHTVDEETQAKLRDAASREEGSEKPAPETSEPARPRRRRRASEAFHTVDEETQAKLRDAASREESGEKPAPESSEPAKPESSEESKPKKGFGQRTSDAFHVVDEETQARLREVSRRAARNRANRESGDRSKEKPEVIEGEGRVD